MNIFKSFLKNISSNSIYTIYIFLILAFILVLNAVLELNQSKKDLFSLMTEDARSLLESLLIASYDVIKSNEFIEEISQKRLLNNAFFIKELYEKNEITNKKLIEFCNTNEIKRVNIFNKNGKLIFSNFTEGVMNNKTHSESMNKLNSIFTGEKDTVIIGYKKASCVEHGLRYPVAISTSDSSAIVVNIDAELIKELEMETGFGALIRNIAAKNKYIVYAALQDSFQVIAGSDNVNLLEEISESDFLKKSFQDSLFATRITNFDSKEIFEAVHPFTYDNETIGLYRLGISLEPIHDINNQMITRLVIITAMLIFAGILITVILLTQYKFSILKNNYEIVETYSGSILNNVSDAIIVIDRESGIKVFNEASEKLFAVKQKESLGLQLKDLFNTQNFKVNISSGLKPQLIECTIQNRLHALVISRSSFNDRNGVENTIYVIRDITDQKKLEESLERSKRMTAMGELASGVAHEIRNPLNTIGTIIQQLDKDFEPTENSEEYHEFAKLVYNEVHRINETVQSFLQFSKPTPIYLSHFPLSEFINQIQNQYQPLLLEKNISFGVDQKWSGKVKWDKNQIKQVFINIIQNAIEAIEENGSIAIKVLKSEKEMIEIHIRDTGSGMDEKTANKIFNLYYSSKNTGTGIGLSVVQKIIQEHNGTVTVESEPGKGTDFIIVLPSEVELTLLEDAK
jgi:PAS domain S-box-containing protein